MRAVGEPPGPSSVAAAAAATALRSTAACARRRATAASTRLRSAAASVAATTALLVTMLSALIDAGCGEAVDAPPPGAYKEWDRFVFRGDAPGHGDSYRIVYVNPTAALAPTLYTGYPDGSIFVKEVREEVSGEHRDLSYVAIMRRMPMPDGEAWPLTDRRRWLFSVAETSNGEETSDDACWSRCHVAAPYNGAWYDYRRPPPPPPPSE